MLDTAPHHTVAVGSELALERETFHYEPYTTWEFEATDGVRVASRQTLRCTTEGGRGREIVLFRFVETGPQRVLIRSLACADPMQFDVDVVCKS